jgi:hypothetical protein
MLATCASAYGLAKTDSGLMALLSCVLCVAMLASWCDFARSGPPNEFELTHRFKGVLPAEAREVMEKVRASLPNPRYEILPMMHFDPRMDLPKSHRILLIEEAYDWKIVAQPRNLDPLLVLELHGEWYLLHKFDVTPAEQWLAQEAVG